MALFSDNTFPHTPGTILLIYLYHYSRNPGRRRRPSTIIFHSKLPKSDQKPTDIRDIDVAIWIRGALLTTKHVEPTIDSTITLLRLSSKLDKNAYFDRIGTRVFQIRKRRHEHATPTTQIHTRANKLNLRKCTSKKEKGKKHRKDEKITSAHKRRVSRRRKQKRPRPWHNTSTIFVSRYNVYIWNTFSSETWTREQESIRLRHSIVQVTSTRSSNVFARSNQHKTHLLKA